MELCGGLTTGLEALLRAGYAINSYAWVDIDPDAHTAVSYRIADLKLQFPFLLPLEAIKDWDSQLPMDVRAIFLELLIATFPEGVDLLASPPMLANHLPNTHRERSPMGPDVVRHIHRLILNLSEARIGGVGYLWTFSELHSARASTLPLLGQGTLLDATKCCSGAYRSTRVWQNLLTHKALVAEHACLLPPTRAIDAALETSRLT
jgi:hypothetical protein